MADILGKLLNFGMSAGVIAGLIVVVFFLHQRLLSYYSDKPAQQHHRQLIMICIWLLSIILAVLFAPIGDAMRGQLLSFLGILLSATIALSSTTIVGNAMAGLMLKSLRNCHVGDFIRAGDHFGRISEMDLLHVEIQTEDRDLTTLPNLYLVTTPMTVLRSSGTVLHVEVSLGYDIPRLQVEDALMQAAERSDLEKPFVQILSLGDFSVTYRIAGLLTDINQLLTARRRLRSYVLDSLHDANIEIMSPTFMSTRSLAVDARIMPAASPRRMDDSEHTEELSPDDVVFDKAQQAEMLEGMKQEYTELSQELLDIEVGLKELEETDDARRPLTLKKKKLEANLARREKAIAKAEEELA